MTEKRMLIILFFIIGLFVAKFALRSAEKEDAAEVAKATLSQIEQKAEAEVAQEEISEQEESAVENSIAANSSEEAKSTDQIKAEAVQRIASEQLSENLKNEQDENKRKLTAASSFMGFLLINERTRAEFCNKYQVDIFPFVAAFKHAHSAETAKAKSLLASANISPEEVFEMLKPQMEKTIEVDMKGVASSIGGNMSAACELLAKNGVEIAKEMHISKLQPDVYTTLMGTE